MSTSATSYMPMVTAARIAVVASIGLVATGAIMGTNTLAKVVFGTLSVAGTSRLALLPLDYFCKKNRTEKFIAHLIEASVIGGIAYGGLYAATDANLIRYIIPVVVATWLYAGPIVYRQGIVESVGELDGVKAWRAFGALHVRRKTS